MKINNIRLILPLIAILIAACGSNTANSIDGIVIKTAPIGTGLTVTLSNTNGAFTKGEQEVILTFTDADGKPADVGYVSFRCHIQPEGELPFKFNSANLSAAQKPGVYRGKINIDRQGEWQAIVFYEAESGKADATFPITVR